MRPEVLVWFALVSLAFGAPMAQDPASTWVAAPFEIQGIVGGEPAEPRRWPEVAALFWDEAFACTGVLIDPEWVLTAGHCGDWQVDTAVVGATDYAVEGERVGVVEIIVHPEHLRTYDVALLRLAQPVSVPVRPIAADCVAEDWLADGAPVAIVGYGALDSWASDWGTVLHEAHTEVVDHDCSRANAGCNEAAQPAGELIAGGAGVDSCNGDSGGPLYLSSPGGDFLLGITSRAAAPVERPCGDGGIYVRVEAVVPWIEETTGLPVARPDCENMNRAPSLLPTSMTVGPGGMARLQLKAEDPDPQDTHRFEVVEAQSGWASVTADGLLVYGAPGSEGSDLVRVRITDDGEPPIVVEHDIAVHITGARARACSTTGQPGGAVLLLLLVLGWRRR